VILHEGFKYDIARPEFAMLALAGQESSINMIELASSLL
jgi:hypothetical protein